MVDDLFGTNDADDNQESLMGDEEFAEVVEATVEEVAENGEESLEAKINHGIGTLDINVGKVSETDFARVVSRVLDVGYRCTCPTGCARRSQTRSSSHPLCNERERHHAQQASRQVCPPRR